MIPSNPRILVCPYCGKEKEIMSLISRNTCGAEYWSDNKQIAPMLPEISYVQRCLQCNNIGLTNVQDIHQITKGLPPISNLLIISTHK